METQRRTSVKVCIGNRQIAALFAAIYSACVSGLGKQILDNAKDVDQLEYRCVENQRQSQEYMRAPLRICRVLCTYKYAVSRYDEKRRKKALAHEIYEISETL